MMSRDALRTHAAIQWRGNGALRAMGHYYADKHGRRYSAASVRELINLGVVATVFSFSGKGEPVMFVKPMTGNPFEAPNIRPLNVRQKPKVRSAPREAAA